MKDQKGQQIILILVVIAVSPFFTFNQAKSQNSHSSSNQNQKQNQKPPRKTMSVEDNLKLLKNAKRFEDAVIGEAMDHSPTYKAYQNLLNNDKVETAKLVELVKNGSPAGKLFGAALLLSKEPDKAPSLLKTLKNDTSEFEYKSGCKVCSFSLGDAAKDLLETGKFLNFKTVTKKTKP